MQVVLDEIVEDVDNELSPLVDNEEDMSVEHPTLTERMIKVEGDIREILDLLKRKKRRNWMPLLGLVVAILTLGIGYVSWWQPQHKLAEDAANDLRIKALIDEKFREHNFDSLVSKVDAIKGSLDTILAFQSTVIGRLLQQDARLPQPEFQKNLSSLATTFDTAKENRIAIDDGTIKTLQNKLSLTSSNASDYWRAASSLVNYRSSISAKVGDHTLPNCWDTYRGNYVEGSRPSGTVPPNYSPIETQDMGNCELTLDDGPQFRNSGFGQAYGRNSKEFPAIRLVLSVHDAVVTYSGGKVVPFYALVCRKCVFRTSVSDHPLPQGQRVIRQMLTADNGNVRLSGAQAGL